MDDIVKQALMKWPNVPHCYGWLGLDARGNWYMRDDRAQAAGPFSGSLALPGGIVANAGGEISKTSGKDTGKGAHSGVRLGKGSLLKHEKLIDFIQRNYASDAVGQWFFQNGPQRVYVELEATPWVWRIDLDSAGRFSVAGHDGHLVKVQSCVTDESGRVYLATDAGFGIVHSQDVEHVADAIEAGLWQPQELHSSDLPTRFAYVVSPELQNKAGKLL
jgi:hypothetical protein